MKKERKIVVERVVVNDRYVPKQFAWYITDEDGKIYQRGECTSWQDGIQKAIDFYAKALNLPKVEDFEFPTVSNGVKKAATKKKATTKK